MTAMNRLSTLCYIEQNGKYLMLHRTVKKNDVNKDKWIGVGGHFEEDESPEECLLREVREETGYTLTSWKFRGIVTFISGDGVTEYMHLFTANGFTGTPAACDEGELEWVDIEKVWSLNIWEGDKIFFRLIDEGRPFFSLKLTYDGKGGLTGAVLDGKPMELFDILDAKGQKTGLVRERGVTHREGSPHATAHIWFVRRNRKSGYDVLLQKRAACKDSNPGCYDCSSAGHVAAGGEYMETALREVQEELGITVEEAELEKIGVRNSRFEGNFYGFPFRDWEFSHVYICKKSIQISDLQLQPEEVESVCWMDMEECHEAVKNQTIPHCIYEDEFTMLKNWLDTH